MHINLRGHKFGKYPLLPLLVVCTVQHALNARVVKHPDSKRQTKAKIWSRSLKQIRALENQKNKEGVSWLSY